MPITPEQFYEYLKSPLRFPEEFKDYVADYFATNVPKLHVSQIYGFKLQSVKVADEVTALTTVSGTSYTAAGGPDMTDIPHGFYLAMYGATYANTAGQPYYNAAAPGILMSPSIDGAAASDDDAALLNAGSNGRVALIDLTGSGSDTHTISMRYKLTTAGTAHAFYNAWLFLLKAVTEDA